MYSENFEKSQISHALMLGLIDDDRDTKVHQRHVDVRDIGTVNKHLTDKGEHNMRKDEKMKATYKT